MSDDSTTIDVEEKEQHEDMSGTEREQMQKMILAAEYQQQLLAQQQMQQQTQMEAFRRMYTPNQQQSTNTSTESTTTQYDSFAYMNMLKAAATVSSAIQTTPKQQKTPSIASTKRLGSTGKRSKKKERKSSSFSPDDEDDSFEDDGTKKNFGRWLPEEHELFLQGLAEYGKEWKKIATRVRTRTLVQIRTHAQKYFLKLYKSEGKDPSLATKRGIHLGDGFAERKPAKKRASTSSSSSSKIKKRKGISDGKSSSTSTDRRSSAQKKSKRKSSSSLRMHRMRPYRLKIVNPDKLSVSRPPLRQPRTPVSTKAKGRTPLHVACLEGKIQVVSALLDSYNKESSSSPTPSILLPPPPSPPPPPPPLSIETTDKLLPPPPPSTTTTINMDGKKISKPLSHLITGNSNITTTISQSTVDKQDKRGYTALMIAASLEDENTALKLVKMLLEHDANFLRGDRLGLTALHWAASVGNGEVVRLLIQSGCPKDILSQSCETALHRASRLGHPEVVKILLEEFKSDWKIRNTSHRGAFEVAGSYDDSTVPIADRSRIVRKQMRQSIPELKTLVLHHKDCMNHVPRGSCPWEAPSRITAILNALQDENNFDIDELMFSENFPQANVRQLSRVHSEKYIRFVFDLAKMMEKNKTPVPFTPKVQETVNKMGEHELKDGSISDTSFSEGSLDAALRAAGAVCHGIQKVMKGEHRNAFCAVRPPGHHAGVNGLLLGSESCGFCIFNNVCIGALYALTEFRDTVKKVAIVDFDVHHGNGTEEVVRYFSDSSKVLFISIHLYLTSDDYEFYPGTGSSDYIVHNVVNVPLEPMWVQRQRFRRQMRMMKDQGKSERNRTRGGSTGCACCGHEMQMGQDSFMKRFQDRVLPALRSFDPDLILLSAGFDAGKSDVGNAKHTPRYQTGMDLQPAYYASMTEQLMYIADITCEGRIVSVLEGGYGRFSNSGSLDRVSFAMCVQAHVGVLAGQSRQYPDVTDDAAESSSPPRRRVENDEGDDERIRYCTCGTDGEDGSFMIECSNGKCCKGWVHPSCVGLDMSEEEAMKLENFVCPWCRAMIGPAAVSPKKRTPSEGQRFKDNEISTEDLIEMLKERGLDTSGRRATLLSRIQTYEKEQARKEKSSPQTSSSSSLTLKKSTSKNEDEDTQEKILRQVRKDREEEGSMMDVDEEEDSKNSTGDASRNMRIEQV